MCEEIVFCLEFESEEVGAVTSWFGGFGGEQRMLAAGYASTPTSPEVRTWLETKRSGAKGSESFLATKFYTLFCPRTGQGKWVSAPGPLRRWTIPTATAQQR